MNWPSPRKRQIDRDYQALMRLGALHRSHIERPTVDGLAAAADITPREVRRPMDDTLLLMSIVDLLPSIRVEWDRTLEDILLLPERVL